MSTPRMVEIADRRIGDGRPPYVVAELSANHNGDLKRALAIVDAAKAAGADAVKIQTYTADTLTIDHNGPGFRIESGLWAGRSLHDLYREAHTPWAWHRPLFEHARAIGITLFSSPFDDTAVALLEELGCPAYKIASFECVDLPLIERVARTGKPVIISTGMATLGEIEEAVAAARDAACRDLVLLHCVSGYPSDPAEANLRTIPHLADAFAAVVGLSDHTLGTAVPVAAVAVGAAVIEKHFTLKRADGGPDSAFSLEPEELSRLVADCRTAAAALGRPDYDLRESERKSMVFRRSLYVVKDVARGERFTRDNVRSIRPGLGLPPKALNRVLGSRASRDLERGSPLDWTCLAVDG